MAFSDIAINPESNTYMADFVRSKIGEKVHNLEVARLLMPHDHPIGSKRICVDTEYFETYNRENVSLVDVRTSPIEEIMPGGLRTRDAEYELDAIVFATGFDAMTGALLNMDIRGKNGQVLKEKWADGPRTYLGVMTAGFPNLFIITGPGSPSVLSNMTVSIEQHVEWISDCLNYMLEHHFISIEPALEAENSWVAHVNEVANLTLFPLANSWYLGANIPGKPRIFMPYVGGVGNYRNMCQQIAEKGYEGFTLIAKKGKEMKMTTRHLVDPEILPMLDMFPGLNLTTESLPQMRAFLKEMNAQMLAELPEYPEIAVSERHIPGPQGAPDVRVLVYLPKNVSSPVPALLWIHGGGYVLGNAEQADPQVKLIVSTLGCAAVSVDYRLAPETPHPGPVEDCYAALKWLYLNASDLGVDPNRIAIGGDSAGGGLAAGLALLTRDRSEVPLVFQLLIYPMLDDRTVTLADPHPFTGEFVWTPEANRFGWTALLGQEPGGPSVSPYAAAARAQQLERLPPAYIAVGTLDLFLEEDMEYARRLIRAGVPTELHVYPGAFHGFPMVADAKVAQAHTRDYLKALSRAFNKS